MPTGAQPPDGMRALPRGGEFDTRLAQLHSALTELLAIVEEDARHLDASLEDAHELVQGIRVRVKKLATPPDGSVHGRLRRHYDAFNRAREAESDAYEVYADDLEHFRKRQRMSLAVAESDSDRRTLVRRRRTYISMLSRCRMRTLPILDIG